MAGFASSPSRGLVATYSIYKSLRLCWLTAYQRIYNFNTGDFEVFFGTFRCDALGGVDELHEYLDSRLDLLRDPKVYLKKLDQRDH